MALEQHLGKRADARADQFSFAVALYESVCGAHPFAAGSAAQIAENIMDGRIHKPRQKVPSWLVRALLPALAAEPAQRYSSMSVLLDKLRDRRPSRVRTLATVVAGAGVLFAAGGFVAMSQDEHDASATAVTAAASPCRDTQRKLDGVWDAARMQALEHAFRATGSPRADREWDRVRSELTGFAATWAKQRAEACEATHVHHEQSEQLLDLRIQCLDRRRADLRAIGDELLAIDAERLEGGIDLEPLRSLEGCGDVVGLQQEVQPPSAAAREEVAQLRARERHLRALLAAGRSADRMPEARALVADAAQLGYPPVQAEALLTLAGLLWAHDDFSAMEATLLDAVEAAKAGRAHRLAAEALVELLWVVGEERGRYADAHNYAKLARAELKGIGGDERLEALLDDSEGVLWLRQKDLAKARPLLERGHALYQKVHGSNTHQWTAALEHLGLLAQAERRFDDAAQLFRRAFQIAQDLHGFEHSATLTLLAEEAKALAQAGHLDEAAAVNQRGHDLLEDDDATGVMFLANLGLISWKRKQHDQARDQLTRALAIIEKHRGPDHPDVAEAALDLGRVLADLGRLPEATEQLTRAVATYERAFGPDHPDLATALIQLGQVQIAAGKRDAAAGSLERAISIQARSAATKDELEKTRELVERASRSH
jgi:serine/threonine-protein kinase